MKVNIIRSETWLEDNLENIESILNETISEFIDCGTEIINIQVKKETSGLSRFWIYTTEKQ